MKAQELADPLGSFEVAQHQDTKESARGAGRGVETLASSALEFVRR